MPTTSKKKMAKKPRTRGRAGTRSMRRSSARPARREGRLSPSKGLQLGGVEPSLTVNDLPKSLAWYRDTLGFVEKERWEHEGQVAGVELAAGQVSFYLMQDDWQKGRDRVKGEGFRLYCTTKQDVDQLAQAIRERGGSLLTEPHDEPWGGRAFAVADPDGFKITFTN